MRFLVGSSPIKPKLTKLVLEPLVPSSKEASSRKMQEP